MWRSMSNYYVLSAVIDGNSLTRFLWSVYIYGNWLNDKCVIKNIMNLCYENYHKMQIFTIRRPIWNIFDITIIRFFVWENKSALPFVTQCMSYEELAQREYPKLEYYIKRWNSSTISDSKILNNLKIIQNLGNHWKSIKLSNILNIIDK